MVRVKECCCGCSLRTGTLILLWLSVIGGILTILQDVVNLSKLGKMSGNSNPPNNNLVMIYGLYSIISSIVCLVTAIFGIKGIQQNTAKYLTPYLYYMGSTMVVAFFVLLVGMFNPRMYSIVLPNQSEFPAEIFFLTLTFALALDIYFFIVIKSCRDSMLEKAAGNNEIANSYVNAPPPYAQA